MSRRRQYSSANIMQSEVFIIVMALMILLYVATLRAKQVEQPPLITLDQASGFAFETASAELTPEFAESIRSTIIPTIASLAKEYNCDIIEVFGHTDGQPYTKSTAIGDIGATLLESLVAGDVSSSVATNNLELGMLRAAAITQILNTARNDGRLSGIEIVRPYSAGEMIDVTGALANPQLEDPDATRRRIEIRLSRSSNIDLGDQMR